MRGSIFFAHERIFARTISSQIIIILNDKVVVVITCLARVSEDG